MLKILFVCYANICRSPMAEAIMAHLVSEAGLAHLFSVTSAGTNCVRVGEPAFVRTADVLSENGLTSTSLAKQLQYDDLNTFNYILAMDRRNLTFMLRHSAGCTAEINLLLHYAHQLGLVSRDEVHDPYPNGDFQETYDLIHLGCTALLLQLRATHQL